MDIVTLIIVTASDVFALEPILKLYNLQRYYGCSLVTLAMCASIMMHMTETKHNLHGLFRKYSNYFLNFDRVIACLTGLYGAYLFFTGDRDIWKVVPLLLGALSAFIGESTNNLYIYMPCHILWHFLAYTSLANVAH
jgi:hypothetical protein